MKLIVMAGGGCHFRQPNQSYPWNRILGIVCIVILANYAVAIDKAMPF